MNELNTHVSMQATGTPQFFQTTSQVHLQNPVVKQAEKDLESLKSLKREDLPANILCPMCEKRGITETHKKTSIAQWVFCLGMFTVGCAAGCCLIPFCVDGCKDTIHICSHCKVPLGRKTLLM